MPYDKRAARLRLMPLVVPIGGLFAAGATVTVLQSFGYLTPLPESRGTGDAWMYVFADRWIWLSVLHSLVVAAGSAGISVALGTCLAWGIHQLPGRWQPAAAVYRIPLVLPHLTVAFLAILLFGQAGLASSLAARAGLIQSIGDFPNLLYSGHGIGVMLAYVMKETSFAALMAVGQLRKLDDGLVRSARMLGASRWAVLRDVVLPHLHPVLVSSFLILALYALGAFEIPWLIGESKPQMLSVTVYNLYFQRDLSQRPEAAALLSMLMGLSALIIYAGVRITRRSSDHA